MPFFPKAGARTGRHEPLRPPWASPGPAELLIGIPPVAFHGAVGPVAATERRRGGDGLDRRARSLRQPGPCAWTVAIHCGCPVTKRRRRGTRAKRGAARSPSGRAPGPELSRSTVAVPSQSAAEGGLGPRGEPRGLRQARPLGLSCRDPLWLSRHEAPPQRGSGQERTGRRPRSGRAPGAGPSRALGAIASRGTVGGQREAAGDLGQAEPWRSGPVKPCPRPGRVEGRFEGRNVTARRAAA